MIAVLIKAAQDLRGRPFQSLLVTLTVGAASALLYLGLVTLSASHAPYDRQMERADGAHAWIYISGGEAARGLADRISALPGVSAALPPRLRWSTRLLTGETTPRIDLVAVGTARLPFDRYLVTKGRDLAPGDTDHGVLDASFARYWGINVGDRVQVLAADGPRTLTVVGLQAEPRICHFPSCGGVHLYLPEATFAAITRGLSDLTLLLGLKLTEPALADRFISAAKGEEAESGLVADAISWLRIRSIHRMNQAIQTALIFSVSMTAVAAAGLITANIIGGAVVMQHREIGVLKTLGFTPAQVLMLYVGQNLLLALAGGAAGTVGGHLLAARRLEPLAFSMGDQTILQYDLMTSGLTIGAMMAISALIAALAAWRAVRTPPQQSLAGGFSAPSARIPLFVRLVAALRLPMPAILGLKDLAARPGRMVLTVLSVALGLVTVAMSTGLDHLTEAVAGDRSFAGINYDLRATLGELSLEEAIQVLVTNPLVRGYYTVGYQTANLPDHQQTVYLRGVGGSPEQFRYPILAGRMVQGPGEILLTPVLMERMGLSLGDPVRVSVGTATAELKVVGQYRSLDEMGLTAMTTLETLQRLSPETGVGHLMIGAAPGADPAEVQQALQEQSGHRLPVEIPQIQIPPFALDALRVVRLLSLIMATIAVLSVLNAALLTAREQMREFGICKAVGMTPAQILAGVVAGGAWVGLLGGLIGVPGGAILNRQMVNAMAAIYGAGPMAMELAPATAAALVVFGILLAVLAAIPAALWAGRLTAAAVLSAE